MSLDVEDDFLVWGQERELRPLCESSILGEGEEDLNEIHTY